MATNRPTSLFRWMTTITATSMAAGLLAFSLLSIFTPAGNQRKDEVVDEKDIQFFLWCLRMSEVYLLPPEQLDSHRDKGLALLCKDCFRLLMHSYQDTGRLPPGYKEALLIWYKNNQTLVDIEICGLDGRRCSDETAKLMFRYDDEVWEREISKRI